MNPVKISCDETFCKSDVLTVNWNDECENIRILRFLPREMKVDIQQSHPSGALALIFLTTSLTAFVLHREKDESSIHVGKNFEQLCVNCEISSLTLPENVSRSIVYPSNTLLKSVPL